MKAHWRDTDGLYMAPAPFKAKPEPGARAPPVCHWAALPQALFG